MNHNNSIIKNVRTAKNIKNKIIEFDATIYKENKDKLQYSKSLNKIIFCKKLLV